MLNPPAWGLSPGDLQLGCLLAMGRAPHWHWWGSNGPFPFTVLVSPGPWLRRLGRCDGRRYGEALQAKIPCEGTLQARSPVKCKPYGKTFPVKHEPGGRKFHSNPHSISLRNRPNQAAWYSTGSPSIRKRIASLTRRRPIRPRWSGRKQSGQPYERVENSSSTTP